MVTGETKDKPLIDPVEDYLDGLPSIESRRTQRSIIRNILRRFSIDPEADMRTVPWEQLLTKSALIALMKAATKEGKSASYHNNINAAFRGIANAAYKGERISYWQLTVIESVKYMPVIPNPDRPVITPEVVWGLLRFCLKDDSLAGLRDACLVAMAFSTGLQTKGLALLSIEHFTYGIQDLSYFRSEGKSGIELEKHVPNDAQTLLREWLQARTLAGANPNSGHIFYSIDRYGNMHIREEGMSTTGIRNIFQRRTEQYCDSHLKLHDYRRAIIAKLFDEGQEPREVAQWSGHRSVATLLDNYERNKSRHRLRISNAIKLRPGKRTKE